MNRTIVRISLALATAVALLGVVASPAAAFAAAGSWTAPYSISHDVYGAFRMETSPPNAAGSFVSSWAAFEGSDGFYSAAIWAPGAGWGAPHKFADGLQFTLSTAQSAIANDGRALVAWRNYDAPNDTIQASVFEPLSGWSPAADVSAPTADISIGYAAADLGGGLHLSWMARNGSAYQAWVAYYAPGSGWGAPERVDPGADPLETSPPLMEDDGAGGIIAVWDRFAGPASTTWWSAWSPTGAWSPVLPLVGVNTSVFYVMGSTHDLTGRAHFLFVEWPGATVNISTLDYSATSGWAPPQIVAKDADIGFVPVLACDAAGNLALVWTLNDLTRDPVVAAVRPAGSAWGLPAEVGVSPTPIRTAPSIAFLEGGEVVAAWDYPSPLGATLAYARYTPALGWSGPSPVPFNVPPGSMQLTGLPGSRAMITVSSGGPWSLEYNPPDIAPPALAVSSPSAGWVSNVSTVTVSGTSEPGATVSVNGLTTIATPGGTFSVPLALSRGDNLITVTAADASGNLASSTLSVWFDDPAVGLAENLTAAVAQVAALQASLNATQAQLDALEANATGGGGPADTSALGAQLNATRYNLTIAQTRLDETETALAEMTSSQSHLETQQGDLRALNVQLASQLAILSVLAAIALLAALAAIGLLIVQARRAETPRAVVSQAPEPAKGSEHDKGEPPKPRG